MAEQHLITAEFFGAPVTIIDHAGKRWLTAEQIGRCLGYANGQERKAIAKLYERHGDEFSEADTCVVNLTTPNSTPNLTTNSRGNPTYRIFSGTGCVKLGFFANTPTAKKFRAWAATELETKSEPAALPAVAHSPRLEASVARMAQSVDVLAAGMSTVLTQLNVTSKYIGLLEMNQVGKARITPTIRRQCREMAAEGISKADIGRLLRISRTAVSLICSEQYPVSKLTDAPPETMGDKLEAWIAREQAKLAGVLKGGAE